MNKIQTRILFLTVGSGITHERNHDWHSDDHAEDRDIAKGHAAAAGQRAR